MHPFRCAVIAAALTLTGLAAGCGEDQPNAPATPEQVTAPDFGKNAGEMMQNANKGMDPKKVKSTAPKK